MKVLVKKTSHLLYIIRYPLFVIVCFCFIACENNIQEVNAFTQKKTGVEEASDISMLYSTNGKIKAKLTSPKLYRYQTDTAMVEFPDRIHVDFYDSSAKIESKLSAKYAKYYESKNEFFLKDSVQLINQKGDTVNTTRLYWDQAKAIFYTNQPVSIKQKDKTINGIGLTADQDFKNWTINNVQGAMLIADSLTIGP